MEPVEESVPLPGPTPTWSQADLGKDLYASGNRRMVFGAAFSGTAALTGLGAMALWRPDSREGSAVVALLAEGQGIAGLTLLSLGAQMQRRSALHYGIEPKRNPRFTLGLALGGGALILGGLAPGALMTENRAWIYATTGGAGLLGLGSAALLTLSNIEGGLDTRDARRGFSVQLSPSGVSGTW